MKCLKNTRVYLKRLKHWSNVKNVTVGMCTLLTTCPVQYGEVCGLTLTWETEKLETIDGTTNIPRASWTQCFQCCLVWQTHPSTTLLKVISKLNYVENKSFSMWNQLWGFPHPSCLKCQNAIQDLHHCSWSHWIKAEKPTIHHSWKSRHIIAQHQDKCQNIETYHKFLQCILNFHSLNSVT